MPTPTLQVIASWALYVVALPSALGALVALPFWLKGRTMLGNVAGSCAIALAVAVLIWQQFGAYVRAQEGCTGAGCPPSENALYAFLILVVLGWLDVFFLLFLSGFVEDWRKRRHFDRSRL